MARRVAELDYRVTGDGAATSKVRTLSQALEQQSRNARATVPAMAAAQRGTGFLGAVSAASATQVMALSGAMGPLGAGMGMLAVRAPQAAQGVIALSAAHERMGLLSRASNVAILGGAAVMATAGAVAVGYAGNILRGADAYASMTSRLRIFSDGAVEAAQNEQQLYQRAGEARTAVENLSTLFVRITPAIDDMGRAQSDALQVTENTSKALAIQGATMAENAAATVQFSQAIASGVLRGDELKSMMESSPLLLRYIAQNLELNGKIGVAFGQMRKLGEEGALTADKLINALLRASPQIEADFINAPKTAQQGWVVLKDTITRTIGQMAQTTGLQQGVFDFLAGLSKGLDQFRKDMVLNPDAFDPVVRAGQLLGDTLDRAQGLAGGVVENFDLIVDAGQALIALKVGEVMAVGFGVAASKAREAYTAVQSFRANGLFVAGAALDDIGASAAIQARVAAVQAEARATDLKTQADVRARTATAARTAADAASLEVTRLKSVAGVEAALVSQAEMNATALATAADRAEAGAKKASTAATTAKTAETVKLAIAKEAEAAVTSQVTTRDALNTATKRAAAGVYAMLGGSVGLLTVALGGLVYAIWQSEQAWNEKIRAMRDAAVVSDELEAVSRAMASATWAEIPALMASADALRTKAAAAREAAVAIRDAAQADVDRDAAAGANQMQSGGSSNIALGLASGLQRRRAQQAQSVVEAADRDAWKAREESRNLDLRRRTVDARARSEENTSGRDIAGREISAQRRAENSRALAEARAYGASMVETYDEVQSRQQAAIERASGASRGVLERGLSVQRRVFEAAAELATVGTTNAAPRPAGGSSSGGGGRRRSGASSEDRALQSILERVADAGQIETLMGRTTPTNSRFTVDDGKLQDAGKTFVARSDDEARAAAAYLEQIKAITTAKAGLIEETGMTRAALKAQAAQTLATALATSTATQADQRWQEKLAESRGESTAVAQAEREAAEARRQGANVTDEAVKAYVDLIRVQERARQAQEALNAVRPVVDAVTRTELDKMGQTPERWRTDVGGMGFDADAALKEWADARVRIAAEAERRIRADTTLSAEETARRIAALKVAIETTNAEQIADIWQRQRDDDERAWEERLQQRLDQERELADSITGSFKDLVMGADPGDVGKRFSEDLLSAMYDELIGNPLNLMIKNVMRSLFSSSGDPAGGLWGAIGSAAASLFGGGSTAGGAPSAGLMFGPSMPGHADGGLPGVRRLSPGLIRGPGGPRDDRIVARVSNEEFIVNAKATREHLPWLARINAGLPAFADGGLPGGRLADMMRREIENGDLGYTYARPADADRDRQRYEPSSRSAPVGDIQLNFFNETGQPMTATKERTPEGFDIFLEAAVENKVMSMGREGSLGRAANSAPKPIRR